MSRRRSIVTRVVRGMVFVALLSSLVLATTAAIVARVLWRSSEEREIDATTSALVRVILAEAQEDRTSVETAAPGALDESAVVGYRIEVLKDDGRVVVARPARTKTAPGNGAGPEPASSGLEKTHLEAGSEAAPTGMEKPRVAAGEPRSATGTGLALAGSERSRVSAGEPGSSAARSKAAPSALEKASSGVPDGSSPTETEAFAEATEGWLVRTAPLPEHLTLRVALPEERGRRALRIFGLSLALSAPVCLLIAAAVGWFVGRRTTQPLVAFAARIAAVQGIDSTHRPEADPDAPKLAPATIRLPAILRQSSAAMSSGRSHLRWSDQHASVDEESEREGVEGHLAPEPDNDAPAEVADLERAFGELLDRLGDQVAREREFASNASHELRTPLTAIRLRAERARQAAGPEAATEIDALLAEVDRMVRLVDSLLVLARDVRSGMPRGEVVNLADVTRDAAERAFAGAPSPQAELPDEALVRGDEALLGIAVENLLDNARKFTPRDVPSRIGVDADGARVSLTVTSPGARISDAEREKLFERFYRGPQARESRDGHGLGLPLARHIARLHGGRLDCVSGPTEDARFTLELPSWCAEYGGDGRPS